MNSLTSISQSGLAAAVMRLDAAGNNIANAQTPGYRRQFVLQEEQAGGGVAVSAGRADAAGENLAEDLVQQMVASYSFKANLGVIRTHEAMLGTLLDATA
ncbi:MAG TPA: flagellar basal body protein [Albitalea sp.]|uniref:flagellar basal body protein n=1 Tax=Piscinibacter sp. TaxID=1903157 RepID=UPI002ED1A00C